METILIDEVRIKNSQYDRNTFRIFDVRDIVVGWIMLQDDEYVFVTESSSCNFSAWALQTIVDYIHNLNGGF